MTLYRLELCILLSVVMIVAGCSPPSSNNNDSKETANGSGARPNRSGSEFDSNSGPNRSGGNSTGQSNRNANGLNYTATQLPEFVDLPQFRQIGDGLESASFRLTRRPLQAGKSCKLIIVRPAGSHAKNSLPCYFLAAAGATIFTGRSLGDGDTPELRPWAKAGFVAVGYELDGELVGRSDAAFQRAMNEYEAAQAGLVNARNAVEYVLQKMPEVDPNRLYTGGHSSAGSQSILLAAFDNRIKAAISFNGVIDKMEELRRDAGAEFNQFPQPLKNLLSKINPGKYEHQIKCPVFLFHTEEDSNVSVLQSKNAYQRFKNRGLQVVLKIGHGGHYQPMIDQGIPEAIQWLKKIDSTQLQK